MIASTSFIVAVLALSPTAIPLAAVKQPVESAPAGWEAYAPRSEIAPAFRYDPHGGRDKQGALITEADDREGLHGWWQETLPVKGGEYRHLSVFWRADDVEVPRRSVVVRIEWLDEKGQSPLREGALPTTYSRGAKYRAEPEYPSHTLADAGGWSETAGVYRVPANARSARIELHLQWDAAAKVEWTKPAFEVVPEPKERKVRLAAIHYTPSGKSPRQNREEFAPLVSTAAGQGADLVVLPETLTWSRTNKTYADCAEPVPGPSTDYFNQLAKEHGLYIVAGLLERDGHLIYNVATLHGPDGQLVGKYRKVALPRSEIEAGVQPGSDYPVFDTRFGKVGMMVCYDGFFPEVARELSNRGAEVIAWPVAGCNPLLGAARACENHVYLVSSTYTRPDSDWMITGVWAHDGHVMTKATEQGQVVSVEVDLAQHTYWPSLGDFRAEVPRHRPVQLGESQPASK